jgi:hypothetical protein
MNTLRGSQSIVFFALIFLFSNTVLAAKIRCNELGEEYSVYIEEDDQLIIPSVIYKNAKYTVFLWQVGIPDELIFMVTDVFPITAQ